MTNPMSYPIFRAWDDNGNPLSGGKVYFYEPDTSTAKDTYTSVTLQTANANPVVLDSNGEAVIYLSGMYKVVLKTSGDVTLWTQDFVGAPTENAYDVSLYGAYGSQAAIVAAIADLAGNDGTIYIGGGTWSITSDLTIDDNVNVKLEPGAMFSVSNTKTLTIDGTIEAGPYQIFSGAGDVDISGSATNLVPLQWFGGVPDGDTNNSSALGTACTSIGPNQTIHLSQGVWNIETATNIGTGITYDLKFSGDGMFSTLICIDTAAAVGLTFGVAATSKYSLKFKDMSFVGAASCCTYALDIYQWHGIRFDNVNFYVGATLWAVRVSGVVDIRSNDLRMQNSASGWDAIYGLQENGIMINSLTGYTTTTVDLHCNFGGKTGMSSGVWVDADDFGGTDPAKFGIMCRIRGAIQNCDSYPVYVHRFYCVDLSDLYVSDNCTNYNFFLDNCRNVIGNNIWCGSGTSYAYLNQVQLATFSACHFAKVYIRQNCRGVRILDSTMYNANGLINYAPDTEIVNLKYHTGNDTQIFTAGAISDRRNLMTNSLLTRFTATIPDGWDAVGANGTWAQESTEVHRTTYSMELTASGGTTTQYYTVDAVALAQLKGKFAIFSIWQKIDSTTPDFYEYEAGVTANTYPAIYITPTVSDWAVDTEYNLGDAVLDTGHAGKMFVCTAVASGTSGTSDPATEPTWPTVVMDTVTDNDEITWTCYTKGNSSLGATPGAPADVGAWKQLTCSSYIPKNTTQLKVSIRQYVETDDSDSIVYYAEPFLGVGWQGPSSLIANTNEHPTYIQIGNSRIWALTPGAGTWIGLYDVDLQTGQRCTTAGTQGGTAVWANFP